LDIPADEASRVVKKHLVIDSPYGTSFESDRGGPSNAQDTAGPAEHVDYTSAFKLPGGAITRDVYKWQADQENEQNRRGKPSALKLVNVPGSLKKKKGRCC
jgi:proton-coupled amino acid transporter